MYRQINEGDIDGSEETIYTISTATSHNLNFHKVKIPRQPSNLWVGFIRMGPFGWLALPETPQQAEHTRRHCVIFLYNGLLPLAGCHEKFELLSAFSPTLRIPTGRYDYQGQDEARYGAVAGALPPWTRFYRGQLTGLNFPSNCLIPEADERTKESIRYFWRTMSVDLRNCLRILPPSDCSCRI